MKKLKFFSLKKFSVIHLFVLGIILILGAIGFLIYRKNIEKNEFKTVLDPKKAEQVAKDLVEIVGKIYILPNELPTIATVTDINTLPDNTFFKNAKLGDKILVFPVTHKAIIYRPGINKIVDVADITLETELKQPEVASVATTSAELEVTDTSQPQPTTTTPPLQ